MDDFHDFSETLANLQSAGRLRRRRAIRTQAGGWCDVQGRRLRNFASNDYLDLAHHPTVLQAASDAIAEYGFGSTASPLICGRTPLHAQLEEALARFEQVDAVILFPTGFAANLGTLAALISRNDVVYCDRMNHASLIEGCRASRAQLRVYRHQKLESLVRDLEKSAAGKRTWIVTDSVFSMDGDLAPLQQLVEIATRFEARIIVDEAHATGIFGETGSGLCESLGVKNSIAVRIGTLSKGLGSLGGFTAGAQPLVDFLWQSAATQIYSTSLPPACCAAALASLEIVRSEPQRRERVLQLSRFLVDQLQRHGLETADTHSPIVPILIGDNDATMVIATRLEEAGFLVAAIRPPTVPAGTARLRISVCAGHDEQALTDLARAIAHNRNSNSTRN